LNIAVRGKIGNSSTDLPNLDEPCSSGWRKTEPYEMI